MMAARGRKKKKKKKGHTDDDGGDGDGGDDSDRINSTPSLNYKVRAGHEAAHRRGFFALCNVGGRSDA